MLLFVFFVLFFVMFVDLFFVFVVLLCFCFLFCFVFLPHRCRCNFTNIPLCAVENMLKKPTGDVTMASDPPPFHQMSPWTSPPTLRW